MQHNGIGMTNLLIDQESLYISTLISRQLNDLTALFVLLHGTVAAKVLFKSFADALNVQIVRQTCHGRDTLAPVPLLDTDVYLIGAGGGTLKVVLKGLYNTQRVKRGDESIVRRCSRRTCSLEYQLRTKAQFQVARHCFRSFDLLFVVFSTAMNWHEW